MFDRITDLFFGTKTVTMQAPIIGPVYEFWGNKWMTRNMAVISYKDNGPQTLKAIEEVKVACEDLHGKSGWEVSEYLLGIEMNYDLKRHDGKDASGNTIPAFAFYYNPPCLKDKEKDDFTFMMHGPVSVDDGPLGHNIYCEHWKNGQESTWLKFHNYEFSTYGAIIPRKSMFFGQLKHNLSARPNFERAIKAKENIGTLLSVMAASVNEPTEFKAVNGLSYILGG